MNIPPYQKEAARYIEKWISHQQVFHRLPALQLTIRSGSKVLLSVNAGVRSVATQVPLASTHRFRFASHTKIFTAVIALLLAERGAINLKKPVTELVTELRDCKRWSRVTLTDLLCHRSGLMRDSYEKPFWGVPHCFHSRKELLNECLAEPFYRNDRHELKYSNLGFGLIGIILERATQQDFETLIHRELFERLKLHHTSIELTANDTEIVTPYGQYEGELRMQLPQITSNALAAATGLVSTTTDISHALSILYNRTRTFLSAKSLALLCRSFVSIPKVADRHYGLGTVIWNFNGEKGYGHSGGYPGFVSRSCYLPQHDLTISLASNAIDAPTQELLATVVELLQLFKKGYSSTTTAQKRRLDELCGRYWGVGALLDIFRVGNKLFSFPPNENSLQEHAHRLRYCGKDRLLPLAQSGFANPGEELVFKRTRAGKVESLSDSGGWMVRAEYAERFKKKWRV